MELLPCPTSYREGGPGAEFSDGMVISADIASSGVADLLASELRAATGWQVSIAGPGADSAHGLIRLEVRGDLGELGPGPGDRAADRPAAFPDPGAEKYRLTVTEGGAGIVAPTPAGVFYGTRTLRQLLPADLFRSAPSTARTKVAVEGVEISDAPRFGWRGIGLDLSRHFFPKDFVLKLVDLASLHKLNVLHLHLTDDQGWRVQIDGYPRLTEVGAWRRESPAGHYREGRKDGIPHGGFFTKADLAEIVEYAARRFVTVLPEIDMPGHMQAAIASYPELGNTGEQLEVLTNWGISEHVLNLEENAVRFCTDVLEEIMEVFPGRYVHIGGDECPTVEWESSPRARELCERLGLAGPQELQGWFTARMSEVISAKGRRLVGWNEIVDAGAPPGAVILCWEGKNAWRAAVEGARAGLKVVMAPEPWCYFDWAYSDDPREPLAIRSAISVEQVYSLEPVPDDLEKNLAHRVIGAQCQLWSEYVATPQHAEYMYFPRACALAEVAWSGRDRSWEDFERRLCAHLPRLGALGVNYRPLDGPNPGQARTWATP
ncbi:MAG TPA: beta-N-acetylhexosaminidase [Acidimicrobiales bacterium]|nr:beta-N-acetylhexosaminidase [Acidimicrobiales bacterium]